MGWNNFLTIHYTLHILDPEEIKPLINLHVTGLTRIYLRINAFYINT